MNWKTSKMTEINNTPYNNDFYTTNALGMSTSAKAILKLVFPYLNPNSVIDIGCGRGAWLAAAESLGAKNLVGFDGPWINKENLVSQNIKFYPVNFENELPELNSYFDLCISLEVAEHVSENKAKQFVDYCCTSANIVLFGAAIKNQGGVNHINEQWQTYWIKHFESNGYLCLDIIRPQVWHDSSIEWWYKQNTFLFVKKDHFQVIDQLKKFQKPIYNLVHPENYEEKLGITAKNNFNGSGLCIFTINFIQKLCSTIKNYFSKK
jgi:SAM-dependent methyltransferase